MNPEVKLDYMKHMSESDDAGALLNELMTAYGKDVWNYAYSITRKWDMADDIAQEVFIKVFRNMHAFRRDASVKTWLLTITRNTAIDFKRSAFLRKVTLSDWFEERGERHSSEQEVMEQLAVNDMWKQVLLLPPKYREAIILFAHHQLSMKEMADILGVTEGTVKSRLFHARQKLAKMKERNIDGTD
ncbi:RNA polymerase sigma factor [Cohnella faecalis]|uniref:RNA polymerase sigma factor n=1 Tax=Cohnella faecalis TaxID=2315694 RepID=A0A398CVX9_9BACL|nr:sigma-70 family RNA polymerase sigma factor [Cohnella faecalis]RIE04688.1 sigma-70 family RNA polymerase sigma factor [Cohnella faecalis]